MLTPKNFGYTKKIIKFLTSFLLLLSFILTSANVWSVTVDLKPIIVKAHKIVKTSTLSIGNITLMVADESGGLKPIPFQIDEFNQVGLPYLPRSGFGIKGKEGVFDQDDELLFLWQDASIYKTQGNNHLYELELHQLGQKRYVYLMNGRETSSKRYVNHSLGRGFCETKQYKLQLNPHNVLEWKSLKYGNYQGAQSLVNNMNFEVSGSMLFNVTLDNSNLRPQRTGFKQGAIRSLLQLKTKVVMFGITMMNLNMQAQCYPSHFETYTYAKMPAAAKAISNSEVTVSLTMNVPKNSTIQSAAQATMVENVDGKSDDSGETLNGKPFKQGNWLALDTKKGFALVTYLDMPASMNSMSLHTVHKDTAQNADMYQPEIGYVLGGMPDKREINFNMKMLFVDGIDSNPDRMINNYTKPTFVNVQEL